MIRWDYIYFQHPYTNTKILTQTRNKQPDSHQKIINRNRFNHKIPSAMRYQNNSLWFSNKQLRWQARPIFVKPRARTNSRVQCGTNRLLWTTSLTHGHKRNRSLSDQTNVKRLDIIHQIAEIEFTFWSRQTGQDQMLMQVLLHNLATKRRMTSRTP